MNEEIKENLSEMLFNRDERLLDRITNLQQENEMLKQNINVYREEIKFIKECNHRNLGERIRKTQELEDYKTRCEKAIESLKLKQIRYVNESDYIIDDGDLQEEINTLQNGSDNNGNN